ncbi:hypothetical protein DFH27DRAFT_566009 [Peziza echinospora]|nr:hypothetical protein DFH27DRAFT_566009 [Peziza echinospora]
MPAGSTFHTKRKCSTSDLGDFGGDGGRDGGGDAASGGAVVTDRRMPRGGCESHPAKVGLMSSYRVTSILRSSSLHPYKVHTHANEPIHKKQRRKTPANTELPFIFAAPIATTQAELSWQQQQQQQHTSFLQNHHQHGHHQIPLAPENIHLPLTLQQLPFNPQQPQLNTPPMEYPRFPSLTPQYQLPHLVPIEDDDMMLDDSNTMNNNNNDDDDQGQKYPASAGPPSPYSPVIPQTPTDGLPHMPLDLYNVHAGDAEDGPVVAKAKTQHNRQNQQLKGFKMGYLPDCERCRMKEQGHFGHFVFLAK